MALERMPSDEKLKPTNPTPRSRKSISYSPRQALDSARSLTRGGRKFSLPIDPEASNEKMRLQTQRRHTVGEIFSHDSLFKRKDLPDVKDFKVWVFIYESSMEIRVIGCLSINIIHLNSIAWFVSAPQCLMYGNKDA